MWITHLIAATSDRRHADVQGHIAGHAPGDFHDQPVEHLLTTCTHHKESRGQVKPESGEGSHPDQHEEEEAIMEEPRQSRGQAMTVPPGSSEFTATTGTAFSDDLPTGASPPVEGRQNHEAGRQRLEMSRQTPRTSTGSTSTTSSSPVSTRPGTDTPGPTSPLDMHHRLATIATTLRIQDATGTSHLQQLEMHPEAYGVANTVRPPC